MFKLKTVAVAAALMALPALSQAATPTLGEVFTASGITASGAVDVSYDWSDADVVTGHQFDTSNNTFSLHQVNLLFTKTFADGVSVTLNPVIGDDAQLIGGTAGNDFDLFQGYVSYATGGLTVSAGRFATLAGYEVVSPSGNANASRSFLFFTQPLVHTGVRASYKFSDMLTATVGVVNAGIGAGHVDNNSDKTLEAQVAFTPISSLSWYLTGYIGNEDASTYAPGGLSGGAIQNTVIDTVVAWTVNDMLTLALNGDYYSTEIGGGGKNEVKGVAGYATVKVLPKLALSARGEYLASNGGGFSQEIKEGTFTATFAATDALSLLAEGRYDWGSQQPFSQHGSFGDSDHQTTGTLKAIYKF